MSNSELYICEGRSCKAFWSAKIIKKIKKHLKKTGNDTTVTGCGCLGYCERAVNAMKNGKYFHNITLDNALDVLSAEGEEKTEPEFIDITDDFLGDV